MAPDPPEHLEKRSRSWSGVIASMVLLIAAAAALWIGADIDGLGLLWDERHMQPIVTAIHEQGWTVETLIDYDDTKGPVFFWVYAAADELVGNKTIISLRLVSAVFFVLGGVLMSMIARRCDFSGPAQCMAAILFALLPYNFVLGVLFMSEPTFLFGVLLLTWVFLWGFGDRRENGRPVAGPLLFGLMLAILLHHRVHAVAFGGAAVLVAFERDRLRAWPWVLCVGLAGLSRLPLMEHWGGLVGPSYQARYGMGFRLDTLTYLAIALLPVLVILLWPPRRDDPLPVRGGRVLLPMAILVGFVLAFVATPDMSIEDDGARYLGYVATFLRAADDAGAATTLLIMFLCALGMAAIVSLLCRYPNAKGNWNAREIVVRLGTWAVLLGWMLSSLTRGDHYDRYLLPFAALMPLVWLARLPRTALALQTLGLAGFAAFLTWRWFLGAG